MLQDSAVQDTVEMLVSFVEQSQGPSAADIVDIAQVGFHPSLEVVQKWLVFIL